MNKLEFIEQLKSLLRVSRDDEASLIEEYEAYFTEAMNGGETEEQIITNLETPEEIAANANEDLGVTHHGNMKDFVDIQFEAIKHGYDKVVDSDMVGNVTDTLEEAMKGVGETLKGLDIEAKVSKALEKVGLGLKKLKDIKFDVKLKDMAMKFDNSKVVAFDYEHETLNIVIEDGNRDILNLEVVGGTPNLVVKFLPKTIKQTIELEGDALTINIPTSNIKYSEKKRMRLFIPNSVKNLSINSNVPMSVRDLETSIKVDIENSPLVIKDIEGETLVVNVGSAPIVIKDIEMKEITVVAKHGPISIKDIEAEKATMKIGNGPLSVKDIEIDELTLEAGNGPQTIKFVEGVSHSYKLGSGPKTIKEIELDTLQIVSNGGLLTMKDITVKVLTGDVSGTVKTMKNIEAEDFELNK